MNYKCLIPLLIAPLYCLGETNNSPARDYTMVDLKNGLTTEMLEIGKTSFTFSVEWPLDMKFEEATLFLMGKLNIEVRGWSFLRALYLDPAYIPQAWTVSDPTELDPIYKRAKIDFARRKATFEIPYSHIMWYPEGWEGEKEDFERKAFFAVRVPNIADSPYAPNRGLYEEDDEEDDEKEEAPTIVTTETSVQESEKRTPTSPLQAKEWMPKVGGVVEGELEIKKEGTPNRTNFGFYIGILLFLSAVFYLLRRKLKTGN